MTNTQFSIIIPTYNRGYILWKIQAQKLSSWELLIIDDESTDDTKKGVQEFQKDPRIYYFYKSNGEVSSARNLGLNHAKSNIITYVDSDDSIFPDYLEVANKYLNQHLEKSSQKF